MLKLKAARRSFFRRIWLTGAMLRAPARVEQELPVIAFLNTMQDEIPQWGGPHGVRHAGPSEALKEMAVDANRPQPCFYTLRPCHCFVVVWMHVAFLIR
jgi:hypothetical protein